MFPIILLNKNKSQGNLKSNLKFNFSKINNSNYYGKNVGNKDFSFRKVNFLNYKKLIDNFNNKQNYYEKNFSSIYNDNEIFNYHLDYIKKVEINHNFSVVRNFHKKLMCKIKNKIIKNNNFYLTNKSIKENNQKNQMKKNLSCDNILIEKENKKYFKKNLKNNEIKKILNDEIINVKKHIKNNNVKNNENKNNNNEKNLYISYNNPILEINPYKTKNPNIYNNGKIMFKLFIEENNLGNKILFKHFNANINKIKKKLNYI